MIAVEARAVAKSYGSGSAAVRALAGVDLSVNRGAFVAIMGTSGSGKSTLLAVLGGLDTPDSGEVRIGGQSLQGMKEEALADLRLKTVGFVFQSFNLIPVLTAVENVALPLLLAGTPPDEAERRAAETLRQVGLDHRIAHQPRELSGGEQQRVAIARALVTNPAVILADEPTGSLDSHNTQEVLRTLTAATRSLEQTVVLITHDAAVAAWADRVLFMRDGMLVGEWEPATDEHGSSAERLAAIVAAYERTRSGEATT